MVRTTTTDKQKAAAQWRAAWALLTVEWRDAIAAFCMQSDRDVAVEALKIRSV